MPFEHVEFGVRHWWRHGKVVHHAQLGLARQRDRRGLREQRVLALDLPPLSCCTLHS